MLNSFNTICLLFLSCFIFSSEVKAQHYFKVSDASDTYFKHKLDRFSNNDILIGDSSLEPLSLGANGKIVLTRLDECGNLVWSNGYIYSDAYIEFKDFKISDQDEIFVYGSYYKGLEERIFLAKFDGGSGANLGIRILHPGTVDHFSYTIDIRDNQIMLNGLRFDFNTQKLGFVAVFNNNLTFLWGKTFSPFESIGAGIISEDGGFMCRSGAYLIKLNSEGDQEWATELNVGADLGPNNGPVEVTDGYIFESNRNDLSFFYKVDDAGSLIWKSAQFPSIGLGAAISKLENGNLLCTYNCPDSGKSKLCQLILSAEGDIFDQRKLIFDYTFNTGTIYQSLDENNILTIAANSNPNTLVTPDIKDFIFQFSLDNPVDECWYWEDFEETYENTLDLEFTYYDFDPIPFDMELEESLSLDASDFLLPLRNICREEIPLEFLEKDTLLACGEDWLIHLPAFDYEWQDGALENPRIISAPGTYVARKRSCSDPTTIEYTLEKSNCGCKVFLPNIFSPNFDGNNDYLAFFSDCHIDKMEMTIFDRWGGTVFKSERSDSLWDGTFCNKDMPSGVYIALLKYEFTDLDGLRRQVSFAQDVTLVR